MGILKWTLFFTIALAQATSYASETNTDCQPHREIPACSGAADCVNAANISLSLLRQSIAKCVTSAKMPRIYFAQPSQYSKTNKSIFLLHGLTASPKTMQDLAERFVAQGYNVLTMILQGHGGSNEYLDRQASRQGWIRDVDYAYRISQMLGSKVEGLGHSTGGALLVYYNLRFKPKLEQLYLLDPAINADGPGGYSISSYCHATKKLENIYVEDEIDKRVVSLKSFFVKANTATEVKPKEITATGYCENTYWGNTKTPMTGACALLSIQEDITTIPNYPSQLPASLVFLSRDMKYQMLTSNEKLNIDFQAHPAHTVLRMDNVRHGLLPSLNFKCNKDADKIVEQLFPEI